MGLCPTPALLVSHLTKYETNTNFTCKYKFLWTKQILQKKSDNVSTQIYGTASITMVQVITAHHLHAIYLTQGSVLQVPLHSPWENSAHLHRMMFSLESDTGWKKSVI